MIKFFLTALLTFSLIISCVAQSNSLLSGFTTMTTPRENISIGAQWVDGQGPVDQGLPQEDVFSVKSVSNYEFQQNKELNTNIKFKLLEYLGIKAGVQRITNIDFNINQAEIVRVKNYSSFKFSSGKIFILEGIKVNSLSLTTTRKKADSLSLSIKQNNNAFEIQPSVKNDNETKLTLSGLNLFIAYRLVKFGELSEKENGRVQITTKVRSKSIVTTIHRNDDNDIEVTHRRGVNEYRIIDNGRARVVNNKLLGFKIGKEYEGKIYLKSEFNNTTRQENKDSFIKLNDIDGCKLVLWITSYNEIINGRPKSLVADLNCNNNNNEDFKLNLDSRIQNGLFIIDELYIVPQYESIETDKDFFPVDNDHIPFTKLRFKRTSIPITNYRGSAPGW